MDHLRSEKTTKIGELFKLVREKTDKEKGVNFYLGKMAKYASVASVGAIGAMGTGVVSNSFENMALGVVFVGAAAILSVLKSNMEENSQIDKVMDSAIKDVATRGDLKMLEKVILSRYFKGEQMSLKQIEKDNLLETDLDMEKLKNISMKNLEERLGYANKRYSRETVNKNISYKTEYLEDAHQKLKERLARVEKDREANTNNSHGIVASSKRKPSM